MSPSRLRGVVLDLDETLFDHRESARRGVSRLIEELGSRAAPELIGEWESTADRLMARRRSGEIDREGYRRERVRGLLRDLGRVSDVARFEDADCDRLYARFVELYEQEWVPFEDARPTLRALRQRGIPAAILTNGPEERQQRKVRTLGIEPWVHSIWTSERLAAKKPAPKTYVRVCTALSLEPSMVLHVGDDLDLDVEGARAIGLEALHLDRRRRHPDSSHRIRGLRELLTRF